MDFNLTHTCYGRSNLHPMTQLTYTRRSDGTPEPDGDSKTVVRAKVIHYCQVFDYDEDFYTSRFVLSVFYTITVFHSFQESYTTFRPFPRLFPSVFCLHDTCWVFVSKFYRLFYSLYLQCDTFYPRVSCFLIL
jgi:hypothetical protein